jgi:hypothetical protein
MGRKDYRQCRARQASETILVSMLLLEICGRCSEVELSPFDYASSKGWDKSAARTERGLKYKVSSATIADETVGCVSISWLSSTWMDPLQHH